MGSKAVALMRSGIKAFHHCRRGFTSIHIEIIKGVLSSDHVHMFNGVPRNFHS